MADLVRRLAALPTFLKAELGEKLYGIYVGPGGVPDLDEMGHLRGRQLPSGRGVWDDCGGAYLHRSIILGDRPTPTPDVVLHEVGHALDDIRGAGAGLVSDGPVWDAIYRICVPKMVLPVHRARPDRWGARSSSPTLSRAWPGGLRWTCWTG
ncbi:hypothetical protein ACQP1W_31815 [Spirillospora sp. CA-255316]